jgi:hypothetical protein
LYGDERLAGFLPEVPPVGRVLDAELLGAIGVCTSINELVRKPDGAESVLELLSDPRFPGSDRDVVNVYRAIAELDVDDWPEAPDRLRVFHFDGSRVVEAEEATVVSAPHHRVLAVAGFIVGPPVLAEILGVRMASGVGVEIDRTGTAVRDVPGAAAMLLPKAPDTYVEHDDLTVNGVRVTWWVDDSEVVHAATTDGLARGLAWVGGMWHLRWEVAAALSEPVRLPDVLFERAFDEW